MVAPPESIQLYCRAAHEYKASDLILHAGEPPIVRVSGSVTPMEAPPLNLNDLMAFREFCGVPPGASDHDASFVSADGIRFRVNFHRQLGQEAAVLRRITGSPPDIETLGVPSGLLKNMATRRSGIIIVSGPTGSGKSTTLAALLEWVNKNMERHVVTIEDPIEFVFRRDRALFTQRAVGLDTPSFAEGLRRSLRQAPDIILVGEIRDAITASVALQAAETGHLVLTTLHASDVGEVLERMMAFFPVGEREGHLHVLSGQLLGILCQKLLPGVSGGMVLACEYLSNEGFATEAIRGGDVFTLRDLLGTADEKESRDFLRSLHILVTAGLLSEEIALSAATHPAELRRKLRGIETGNFATR
jgi:twitching motility protein PilT